MSENDIIDTGIELPRMASVGPFSPYSLMVRWAEGPRKGIEDRVDLRPAIYGYKIYRPLRNERLFLSAQLAEDGDAVTWEGKDLEMSAEMIFSLAAQFMSPQDFAAFLARNELTQEAAAAWLGRSRRQVASYATTGPIPRIVVWACYGFEAYKRAKAMANTVDSQMRPQTEKAA